jgi:hypothetical protein
MNRMCPVSEATTTAAPRRGGLPADYPHQVIRERILESMERLVNECPRKHAVAGLLASKFVTFA